MSITNNDCNTTDVELDSSGDLINTDINLIGNYNIVQLAQTRDMAKVVAYRRKRGNKVRNVRLIKCAKVGSGNLYQIYELKLDVKAGDVLSIAAQVSATNDTSTVYTNVERGTRFCGCDPINVLFGLHIRIDGSKIIAKSTVNITPGMHHYSAQAFSLYPVEKSGRLKVHAMCNAASDGFVCQFWPHLVIEPGAIGGLLVTVLRPSPGG